MWLVIVCQAAALFAYLHCMLAGSRWVVQSGWKVISALLTPVCILQACATITLDVILETHRIFRTGHWRLGWCWAYSTASWALTVMLLVGVIVTGLMTPRDYIDFYDSDWDSIDDDDDDNSQEERDDFYYYRRETSRRLNYGT